jgi:hypothetical protein
MALPKVYSSSISSDLTITTTLHLTISFSHQTIHCTMRSYTFAAAFAALAAASPLPQEIDWAAVDALAPIPTVTIPVVDVKALASTISYEPSAAATSIAAEFKASGVTATPSGLKARAAATCKPQPTGSGPKPDTDSAEAFLAYPAYSTTANGASTPAGYYNTFKNLNASNNAYG